MYEGEKTRCNQTQVDLARLIIRLWMIAVNFGGAVRRQVAFEQPHGIGDSKANVAQAALIAAARGIANDDRQNIDAEMIVIRSPDGAADQEAAIAAAEIDDQRRRAAEQSGQIERSLGRQLLEGGLRPLAGIENLTGDRHTKLAFDLPAFPGFFRHGITQGLSASPSDWASSPTAARMASSDWLPAFSR